MKRFIITMFLMVLLANPVSARVGGEVEAGWLDLGKEKYFEAREFLYEGVNAAEVEALLDEAKENFSQLGEGYDRYYWLGRVYLLAAEAKTGKDEGETRDLLKKAVKVAQEALKRVGVGPSGDAYSLLGEAFLRQGLRSGFYASAYLPQAFLLLEKAVVLDPENQSTRSLLAEYYIESPFILGGHLPKATRILEDLSPTGDRYEDFLLAYRLGKAYSLDGQKEKAVAAYQKALKIYDHNRQAQEGFEKLSTGTGENNLQLGVYPILPPLDGFVVGAGVSASDKGISPYLSGSYDLANNLFYYALATRLAFSRTLAADLGYYRRPCPFHPGYLYQQGWGSTFLASDGIDNFLALALFNGEIGGAERDPVTTGAISVAAAKSLYHDWGKMFGIYLDFTAGQAGEENYYISNLKMPLRVNNFNAFLSLGYIDQNEKTDLAYVNLVRGYGTDDQKGEGVVLFRLEQQFPLFPYSTKPFLGSLQGAIFADAGGVFDDWAGFVWSKSVGVGLLWNTLLANVRLDLAFTEASGLNPAFGFEFKMF